MGWIGVDLDGTLAEYDGWVGVDHVGAPVPAMVDRVEAWLAEGREVRIFTARVAGRDRDEAVRVIDDWCVGVFGRTFAVTNVKDFGMVELWDDRAITVEQNTGRVIRHPIGEATP